MEDNWGMQFDNQGYCGRHDNNDDDVDDSGGGDDDDDGGRNAAPIIHPLVLLTPA